MTIRGKTTWHFPSSKYTRVIGEPLWKMLTSALSITGLRLVDADSRRHQHDLQNGAHLVYLMKAYTLYKIPWEWVMGIGYTPARTSHVRWSCLRVPSENRVHRLGRPGLARRRCCHSSQNGSLHQSAAGSRGGETGCRCQTQPARRPETKLVPRGRIQPGRI